MGSKFFGIISGHTNDLKIYISPADLHGKTNALTFTNQWDIFINMKINMKNCSSYNTDALTIS